MNILNKLTPDGRLYMAMRAISTVQSDLEQKFQDRAPDLKVHSPLLRAYYDALLSGEGDRINATWDILADSIAEQIPATWQERLRNWRYLSMLGNPRTHVRNIMGNAGFAPVVMAKNYLGAALEALSGTTERTKSFVGFGEQDRARLQAGWSEYDSVVDAIQSGGKYSDKLNDDITRRMRIFKNGALEGVREFNTTALDVEDTWFSRPQYAFALASWLRANHISAEDYANGNIGEDAHVKAQTYAIHEAQKATYRDTNAFSDFISQLGRVNKNETNPFKRGGSKALDAILPFRKTPANILARAFEYSPAGIAKYVYDCVNQVDGKTWTSSDALDMLASGLTGTALMGLGAFLASLGIASAGKDDDDKEENFNKLRGKQNYALNIPGKGSITIDWLAPEALPFFVGIELYEARGQNFGADEDSTLQDVLNGLMGLADPILETSMLSSVKDLIDSVGYSSGSDRILSMASSAAFSYLSQYAPTLFGQVERVTEDTRFETYRYEKSGLLNSSGQHSVGQLLNKLPGEYNQIPYIDAWGREQKTGGFAQRVFNNMLNPSYTSPDRSTSVDAELQRLYKSGYTNVLPQRLAQGDASFTLYDKDGNATSKDVRLTGEEYVKYNRTMGQTQLRLVTEFYGSAQYAQMSDSDRAKVLGYIYSYSRQIATKEFATGRGAYSNTDNWVKHADSLSNPIMYALYKTELNGGSKNADKIRAAAATGYSTPAVSRLLELELSSTSAYKKVSIVLSHGGSLEEYANLLLYADANGKGGVSKKEAQAAFSKYIKTGDTKAIYNALMREDW